MYTASASHDPIPGKDANGVKAPPQRVRHRAAPHVAFFATVFASIAGAAAVVTEAPLMLVGLY